MNLPLIGQSTESIQCEEIGCEWDIRVVTIQNRDSNSEARKAEIRKRKLVNVKCLDDHLFPDFLGL